MKNLFLFSMTLLISSFGLKAQTCQASFQSVNVQYQASSVQFTNGSTYTPGQSIGPRYIWDFGDGNTSVGANLFHTYSQPGTYQVCLTLNVIDSTTNNILCTNVFCDSVIVPVRCFASFYSTYNWQTPTTLTFNFNSNSNTQNTTAHYSWDFGDGNTSVATSPTHTYSQSGSYPVCVTIDHKDSLGNIQCSASDCDTIVVYSSVCAASFTNSTYAYNYMQRNFQNTSLQSNSSIGAAGGRYVWDFGDGNSLITLNRSYSPNHTYSQSGSYPVCLRQTFIDSVSGDSCVSVFCDTITIMLACQADFQAFLPTGNVDTVRFVNSSNNSYSPNTVRSAHWDFGDGSTSSSYYNTTHLYSQPGTYLVCLTSTLVNTTTNDSCTTTFCDTITISQRCVTSFSQSTSWIHPDEYNFTSSAVANYTNTTPTYSWDFGDGNISANTNPNHTFSQSGIYVVCLTVDHTDSSGAIVCSDTHCDSLAVSILANCQTGFTYIHQNNNPENVYFTGNSGPILNAPNSRRLTWDFGDGSPTRTGSFLSHNYGQPGTFIACLTLSIVDSLSGDSCVSTFCDTINIQNIRFCTAFYDVDSVNSTPTNIIIVNYSTPQSGGQYSSSYHWDFGDGATSNLTYPSHNYVNAGLYTVCLTITSISSGLDTCTETYCRPVGVDSLGNVYFKDGQAGFSIRVVAPGIGIDELSISSVKVYPNPAQNEVTIDLGTPFEGNANWGLYDLKGMNLSNGSVSDIQTKVDISKLNTGIYILRVESGSAISNHKLQVVK